MEACVGCSFQVVVGTCFWILIWAFAYWSVVTLWVLRGTQFNWTVTDCCLVFLVVILFGVVIDRLTLSSVVFGVCYHCGVVVTVGSAAYSYAYIEHLSADLMTWSFEKTDVKYADFVGGKTLNSASEVACYGSLVSVAIDEVNSPVVTCPHCVRESVGTKLTTGVDVRPVDLCGECYCVISSRSDCGGHCYSRESSICVHCECDLYGYAITD